MAYGYFNGLPSRTTSGKVLRFKAFNIAKNLKYDEHQCGLHSIIYQCFDKKPLGGVIKSKYVIY